MSSMFDQLEKLPQEQNTTKTKKSLEHLVIVKLWFCLVSLHVCDLVTKKIVSQLIINVEMCECFFDFTAKYSIAVN